LSKCWLNNLSFQENGQFSQKLYENYLRSVGMTNQGLIASLRQDHALKMISSTLMIMLW
jgi:peptidyl-prolyl cis-trans isomerase D